MYNLTQCLSALHSCFCLNGIWLSIPISRTTQLSLVLDRQRSCSYSALTSVDVAGSTIPLADHVKILGVTLDKHLTFDDHVRQCSHHWRHGEVCRLCTHFSTMPTLLCMACYNVARVSLVVWGSMRRSTNSFSLLKQLHCRIVFKIACITYNLQNCLYRAACLSSFFTHVLKQYVPSRIDFVHQTEVLIGCPTYVSAHASVISILVVLL